MDKVDFKKTLSNLYNPKNKDWDYIDVPAMNFLMVDGKGDPNTAESYKEAVETLFTVAYAVKFMSKREQGRDYVVAPLEGLWYADEPSVFINKEKSAYEWTMMIMQPEWITVEMIHAIIESTAKKKTLPNLMKLRFETYTEGNCLQLIHIGSYDDEAPKLMYLHDEYMPQHSLRFNGQHHEIYLSDPRRVAPEKLKTILRQPVVQV
jgi:hypothetical protein